MSHYEERAPERLALPPDVARDFPLPACGESPPKREFSRSAPLNLVRTRSTASLTSPVKNGTRWNASLPAGSGAGLGRVARTLEDPWIVAASERVASSPQLSPPGGGEGATPKSW
jgi:hypothetical protein